MDQALFRDVVMNNISVQPLANTQNENRPELTTLHTGYLAEAGQPNVYPYSMYPEEDEALARLLAIPTFVPRPESSRFSLASVETPWNDIEQNVDLLPRFDITHDLIATHNEITNPVRTSGSINPAGLSIMEPTLGRPEPTFWNPWNSPDYLKEFLSSRRIQRAEAEPSVPYHPPKIEVPTITKDAEQSSSTSSSLSVLMHVFTIRRINFANLHVQFMIQLYNIPTEVEVTPYMIEAVAQSPSGHLMPCQIKSADSFIVPTFQGFFKANHEAGVYELRVRLVLPIGMKSKGKIADTGVIYQVVKVYVARNYFREMSYVSSSFKCIYESVDDSNSVSSACYTSKLWGLDCDKQTNHIFYTDRAAHTVTCVDPEGRVISQIGQNCGEYGKLHRPTGIACDEVNRRLIISDKDNHRICLYTMDGQYISSFGSQGYTNGSLSYPWDVAVSPSGTHIAVADSRNKRVQVFDRFGNYISKYSIFEKAPFEYKNKFDYPRGICFDNEGTTIYVTDFNVQNILKLPLDMSKGDKLVPDGKLRRPQGLLVDQAGSILVADSKNNCLRHLNSEGQLLSSLRTVGLDSIEYPVNLTMLSGGRIALLDGLAKIRIV